MKDTTMMTRRDWIASAAQRLGTGVAAVALLPRAVLAARAPATLTVYKDPTCGCCTKWVAHLRASGLRPDVHDRTDMDALKDSMGVPSALRSCHTAVAGRYVVEGHVPASDMKRLLAAPPTGVVGIAVPGMPSGAPGMEVPGRGDQYDVIAWSIDGSTRVFAHHR